MKAMKDSGVSWMGDIPNTWHLGRVKNFFSIKGRVGWKGLRSDEFKETSYAYLVTGQDFNSAQINWNFCYQIDKDRYDEDPYIQLCNGDILVTKDGTVGKIALVSNMDKPGCLNSGIFVLRQLDNQYEQQYLYWYLSSPLLVQFNNFMNLGGTTIVHLYQNVFERMPIPCIPLEDQSRISSFLDKKCSEIDSLISLQDDMIVKLQEYKQSVITEAVTRGLDPSVPMKDSGIEWIGMIPEFWVVKRLKFSCKIFGRIGFRGYRSDDLKADGDGAITLSPSNMKDMKMDFSKCTYLSWEKYYESPEIMINDGDVLMVKTGSTYGKCSYVEGLPKESTINPQIVVFKEHHDLSKYISYYFQTPMIRALVDTSVVGGTIPTISQEKILNYILIFPPLEEQHQITDFLDQKCSEIDSLIDLKKQKLETLKEYKKSLIYECVTGKKEIA